MWIEVEEIEDIHSFSKADQGVVEDGQAWDQRGREHLHLWTYISALCRHSRCSFYLHDEQTVCVNLSICKLGRVENCKSSQNQMSQCFFNGFWYIETEGISFFAKKNIFDGWKWTRNLGFGHFQRFLHFFLEWQKIKFILTIPSMSIVIWNLHAKSFPMVPWC